jgi:twitching motility two-component system response regulator PilG
MKKINIALYGFSAKEKEFLEKILKMPSLAQVEVEIKDVLESEKVHCYLFNDDQKGGWQYFERKMREKGSSALFYLVTNDGSANTNLILRPITIAKLKEVMNVIIQKELRFVPGMVINDSDDTKQAFILKNIKKNNVQTSKVFVKQALVVDDSPAVLNSMTQALTLQEIQVTTEAQPEQAILTAKYKKFDIIFLDVMMAGMSGYDLAAEIRKSEKQVPIVMLTSRNSPMDRMRASLAGSNYFLTKPVTSEAIMDVLTKFKVL